MAICFGSNRKLQMFPRVRGCPSGRAFFYGREFPERQKGASVHFWADTPQPKHCASLSNAGNAWGRGGGRENWRLLSIIFNPPQPGEVDVQDSTFWWRALSWHSGHLFRSHCSSAAVPQGSFNALLCPVCPFLKDPPQREMGEAVVATVPRSSFIHSFPKHLGEHLPVVRFCAGGKKQPSAAGHLQTRSRLLRHKCVVISLWKPHSPPQARTVGTKAHSQSARRVLFVFPRRSQNLALLVTCQNKECPCFALKAPSWGCT